MSETLGIAVTTDRRIDHLVGLVKAAGTKGKKVMVFFTGRGVLLTASPRYREIEGMAEMAVCRVSLAAYGLNAAGPIPGIPEKNFTNQDWHGRMIDVVDRYVSL